MTAIRDGATVLGHNLNGMIIGPVRAIDWVPGLDNDAGLGDLDRTTRLAIYLQGEGQQRVRDACSQVSCGGELCVVRFESGNIYHPNTPPGFGH